MATQEELEAAMSASILEELGREVTEATTGTTTESSSTGEEVSSQGVGDGIIVVSDQGVGDGVPVTDTTDTTTDTTETVADTVTDETTDTTTDTTDTTTDSTYELTDEDMQDAYIQTQYDETGEAEDALVEAGILGEDEELSYSSLQADIDASVEEMETGLEEAKESASYYDSLAEKEVETMLEQTKSQQAQVREALSVSREGPTSAGNVSASSQLQDVIWDRFEAARQSVFQGTAARDDALEALEEAVEDGKRELIDQYKTAYAQAEIALQQQETEYYNALAAMSEEERLQQAAVTANFDSFTSMVDSGSTLTTEGLISIANTLNIPFESAYSYYQAAEAIRADKSLDLEEKKLQLEALNAQLEQQAMGIVGEEAQAVNNYLKLVQSGNYSKEELEAFAVAMNIPVENNPVYQAEQAMAAAELAYKDSATAKNYQDVIDAQAKLDEAYGTSYYIPTDSKYEVTATSDGGILIAVTDGQKLDDPDTGRDEGQCGAFVNDVYGTSMGDTIASKLQYTDDSILSPSAGMVFVRPGGYDLANGQGDSGHTGIVESVDLAARTMNIVSANVNNDGRITRETVAITDAYSFGIPPKSKAMGSNTSGSTINGVQISDVASRIGLLPTTVTDKETVIDTVTDLATRGETALLQDYVAGVVFEDLGATDQTAQLKRLRLVETGEALKDLMVEFEEAGGDLGIFSGSSVTIKNKISQSDDPEIQRIAQLMLINLEDFGRAQTGAAIQDFEMERFAEILPNIFDGKELADAKIDAFAMNQALRVQSDLKAKLGESAYNAIYGEEEEEEVEILDPYVLAEEHDPVQDSFYFEYLSDYNR